MESSAPLWMACFAYLVGTASPGPSNLAIMGVAMQSGRAAALATAAGVVCGSLTWGLLAAFGLASVLSIWSGALVVVKILGGLYLLWLASKAARAALLPGATPRAHDALPLSRSKLRLFVRGAAMHITNPKAIFVWLSIVAMAVPPSAHIADSLRVVGTCACIGVLVFGGYAVVFSTAIARSIYVKSRRWFEATFALVFAYAGVRMLLFKESTI